MNITKKEYLKAKKIVANYEKQLINSSEPTEDIIDSWINKLSFDELDELVKKYNIKNKNGYADWQLNDSNDKKLIYIREHNK